MIAPDVEIRYSCSILNIILKGGDFYASITYLQRINLFRFQNLRYARSDCITSWRPPFDPKKWQVHPIRALSWWHPDSHSKERPAVNRTTRKEKVFIGSIKRFYSGAASASLLSWVLSELFFSCFSNSWWSHYVTCLKQVFETPIRWIKGMDLFFIWIKSILSWAVTSYLPFRK